eukprot:CAMPEP_0197182882 /NCGR_PEP_ID=MMETSP1423-20130617/7000_1 /TAXON_ID=476441 /ORGANISM="Pseudo-nitzschia heimii, Strain UNC1101" /LENGTH=389 /DNA_ID=CAMNT_0042633385 /DNA_START=43 /DNA_END=1212 /DNA_ORIENTATION=+
MTFRSLPFLVSVVALGLQADAQIQQIISEDPVTGTVTVADCPADFDPCNTNEVGLPEGCDEIVTNIIQADSFCGREWDGWCVVNYNDCYGFQCSDQNAISEIAFAASENGVDRSRLDCPPTAEPTRRPTRPPIAEAQILPTPAPVTPAPVGKGMSKGGTKGGTKGTKGTKGPKSGFFGKDGSKGTKGTKGGFFGKDGSKGALSKGVIMPPGKGVVVTAPPVTAPPSGSKGVPLPPSGKGATKGGSKGFKGGFFGKDGTKGGIKGGKAYYYGKGVLVPNPGKGVLVPNPGKGVGKSGAGTKGAKGYYYGVPTTKYVPNGKIVNGKLFSRTSFETSEKPWKDEQEKEIVVQMTSDNALLGTSGSNTRSGRSSSFFVLTMVIAVGSTILSIL